MVKVDVSISTTGTIYHLQTVVELPLVDPHDEPTWLFIKNKGFGSTCKIETGEFYGEMVATLSRMFEEISKDIRARKEQMK